MKKNFKIALFSRIFTCMSNSKILNIKRTGEPNTENNTTLFFG